MMPTDTLLDQGQMEPTTLTLQLQEAAGRAAEGAWPTESMRILSQAGCWSASVPTAYGGSAPQPNEQIAMYEAIARGHLTAVLILTQHDGACGLLGDCDNRPLAERLLPHLASGKLLATVGISQLTTSRQGADPALRAVERDGGFRLTGTMPWVTSGPKADHVVTGAVLPDGQQILACLPAKSPGLTPGEPMKLMGLTSSWTTEIQCDNVLVEPAFLMRGPVEKVLRLRAPVKPLVVSACGIGLAGALVDAIRDRASSLRGAGPIIDTKVVASYESVRKRLYDAASALNDPAAEIPSMEIRVCVNDLLAKLAVSLMTVLKGSGYLATCPTQRLVREAMFFLVWSAPPAVQTRGLEMTWKE